MKSSESSDSPDLDSPNLISDDGKTPELELPFVNVDLDGVYLNIKHFL